MNINNKKYKKKYKKNNITPRKKFKKKKNLNNKKKKPLSLKSVASAYDIDDEDAIYAKQKAKYNKIYSSDENDIKKINNNNNIKRRRSSSLVSTNILTTQLQRIESKDELIKSMYGINNENNNNNNNENIFDFEEYHYSDINVSRLLHTLQIAQQKSSNSLVITNMKINDNTCRIVADFLFSHQISMLDISGNYIYSDGIQMIVNSMKFNNKLQEFRLGNNKIGYRGCDYLAELIQEQQNLRVLNLKNNKIGDPGCVSISHALINHSSIEYLNLEDNNITIIGAKAIAEFIRSNSSINQLYIGQNPQISDKGASMIFRAIRKKQQSNNNIIELSMWDCGLSYKASVQLASLIENTNLRSLRLEANQFGDDGINVIAKSLRHNQYLRQLSLGLNQMTSGGEALLQLADSLRYNNYLKKFILNGSEGIDVSVFRDQNTITVNLSHHQLEGEDIVIIAALLLDNTTIMELDLRGNSVDRIGAIALAETLKLNDTLEIIWLHDDRLPVKQLKTFMRNKQLYALESLLSNSHYHYEEVLIISTLSDYYDIELPQGLNCFNPKDIERVDTGYKILEALVSNPHLSLITLNPKKSNEWNNNKLRFKSLKHRSRSILIKFMLFIEFLQQLSFIANTNDGQDDITHNNWILRILLWFQFYDENLSFEQRFYIIISIVILFLFSFMPYYISLTKNKNNLNNNIIQEKSDYHAHENEDDINFNDAHQKRVARTLTMALTPQYLTRPPSVTLERRNTPLYAWDIIAHRLYANNSIIFFLCYLLCFFTISILFLPIVKLLTDSIQCKYNINMDKYFLYCDDTYECYTKTHYITFISCGIILLFYLHFAIRLSLVGGSIDGTFYAPTARGFSWFNWKKDVPDIDNRFFLSTRNYSNFIVYILLKLSMLFVSSYWFQDEYDKLIISILHLTLNTMVLMYVINYLNYHRTKANAFIVSFHITLVYAYIYMIIVTILSSSYDHIEIIISIMLFTIPFVFLIVYYILIYFDVCYVAVMITSSINTPPQSPRRYQRQLSLSERVDQMLEHSNVNSHNRTISEDSNIITDHKTQILSLKDSRKLAEIELKRLNNTSFQESAFEDQSFSNIAAELDPHY